MRNKRFVLALSFVFSFASKPFMVFAGNGSDKGINTQENIFSIIWDTILSIIKSNWLFILIFIILLILYLRHKCNEDPQNRDDK